MSLFFRYIKRHAVCARIQIHLAIPLVEELIAREPFPAPKFWINPEIKDFYAFTTDDIRLDDYQTGPQINFSAYDINAFRIIFFQLL